MHHMYVQVKKDPTHQWLPTKYRLITKDVCLIVNDWEDGWKILVEKMVHPKDEQEHDKSDEELVEGQGNDQNHGAKDTLGPTIT
jgi:hypothetical protein